MTLDTESAAAAATAAVAPRAIQPGEVHVWWLLPSNASSELELQRCSELLTDEELQECNASEDAGVRRERVLARALVRSVLAGYLPSSIQPRDLLFERNAHGKPCLLWPFAMSGEHKLHFNLTHTASLIGLAVTVEGRVGLDVESAVRRTRQDPLRLARRRFSDAEIADLQACPDDSSRAACFLQLWTLKEAYVKALGRGISAPPGLRSFSFRVGRDGPQKHGANASTGDDSSSSNSNNDSSIDSSSSNGSSSSNNNSINSSTSNGSSRSSIEFHMAAPDARCWEFVLLEPAPGHVASLCVERRGNDGFQKNEALQVHHFEAALLDGGMERTFQPSILAQSACP
ncbi:hypothetical protein D9Q98_000298 [Chlorella vulgaris]|uniref:holo-[acyl-carrier-protein] synthase n=1 Tax=Chlorella vulgaris TaxID=3077 RepID=A0A9D4TY35_CHLVU|nr:hypothetical protein D9Q98_000298 [Chlorella vulgaris]